MTMITNFPFSFINVCVIVSFLTKLLTLGTLCSTAVRAVVKAKSVILSILPLASFILVLRLVLVFKLVTLGILSYRYFINTLYLNIVLDIS